MCCRVCESKGARFQIGSSRPNSAGLGTTTLAVSQVETHSLMKLYPPDLAGAHRSAGICQIFFRFLAIFVPAQTVDFEFEFWEGKKLVVCFCLILTWIYEENWRILCKKLPELVKNMVEHCVERCLADKVLKLCLQYCLVSVMSISDSCLSIWFYTCFIIFVRITKGLLICNILTSWMPPRGGGVLHG